MAEIARRGDFGTLPATTGAISSAGVERMLDMPQGRSGVASPDSRTNDVCDAVAIIVALSWGTLVLLDAARDRCSSSRVSIGLWTSMNMESTSR